MVIPFLAWSRGQESSSSSSLSSSSPSPPPSSLSSSSLGGGRPQKRGQERGGGDLTTTIGHSSASEVLALEREPGGRSEGGGSGSDGGVGKGGGGEGGAMDSRQMALRKGLADVLVAIVVTGVSMVGMYYTFKLLDPNRAQAKLAAQKKKQIARRLGKPLIETNQYEDIIACDVINPYEISVDFTSIGGLESVKKELRELVILPLQRPELFANSKLLRPQKGVLLFGPPGTGKTLLAKAVARECSAAFINVRVANLMSKWFGDAQKLVTAVFTLAHKLQPAIIFIDEIDSFLGKRKPNEHEAMTSMKTEFMSLWDGFSTDEDARVMVLCATNRPWELDEAILRRLPRSFEIPLPDREGRANILRVLLQGEEVEANFNYKAIADQCEGYSGSDLTELCKQAAYFPLRDFLEEEKRVARESLARGLQASVSNGSVSADNPPVMKRPLRTSDFLTVLEQSRPSRDAAEEYRLQREAGTGPPGAVPPNGSAGAGADLLLRLLATALTRSASQNGS